MDPPARLEQPGMRVAFDCYYILNWSLWLDLYILARTIKVVMRHEGAY